MAREADRNTGPSQAEGVSGAVSGAAEPAVQPEAAAPPEAPSHAVKRSRGRRWILALVLLVVALVLVFTLTRCGGGKPAVPQPAAVSVAQARTGDMNVYVDALGTVTPVYTVTVYSQVSGQIMAVHYQQGQIVQRGAALIDIDPRPYQSMLMQAEGTLQHDMGLLAQARNDLAIYQAAFARNGISRQQLQDQMQLVVQDEGSVEADQGTVAYDRVQLSYCHIVSPITGLVGLRLVDPGNTVFAGSGSTLVVITQLQPITVVFDVSEDQLPQVQAQLRAGKKLQVDAFDRSDERLLGNGMLTALDNQVDTTTGTVKFRASFGNQNLALFPNQFVNARLLLQTLQQVTLVPAAAVQYNGTATFLYVVRAGNTVAVQPVNVLASDDQNSAVSGLSAGATVVTSGFERIENGVRVSYSAPSGPAR